jgi:hypothetical protein
MTTPPTEHSSSKPTKDVSHSDTKLSDEAAKAARDDMMREVDRELAELTRAIGARRLPGVSDSHLDALELKAGDLQALRDRIGSASSVVQLAHLRHQLAEAVRAAESTTASSGSTTGPAGGHMSNFAIAAESQRILVEGSRELQQSNQLISSWGKQYGVDLSEHDERERDLKKREEELRAKGDVVGALGIHADRYENQIDSIDKLQDSGKVPAADMPKLDAKKKDLYKGLVTTLEQQAKEARVHGMQTEYIDKRLEDTKQAIEQQYGREEITRIEASIDSRSDFKLARLSSTTEQQNALRADATTDVKQKVMSALNKGTVTAPSLDTGDNPFDLNSSDVQTAKLKDEIKTAGAKAIATGVVDTSKSDGAQIGEKTATNTKVAVAATSTKSL